MSQAWIFVLTEFNLLFGFKNEHTWLSRRHSVYVMTRQVMYDKKG